MTTRRLDEIPSSAMIPGLLASAVAAMLAILGSAGVAAFAWAVLDRAGVTPGTLAVLTGLAFSAGLALWPAGALAFARARGCLLSAALRFDAWTYTPLLLLYLPVLRPELPAWPAAAGAIVILGGKFALYWALPGAVARAERGALVSHRQLMLLVAGSVILVDLAGLLTADSFQSGTLAGNLEFMATRPDASYVERLAERGRGHYAAYFAFVREVTPPDAVVLIPPGIEPWYPESDISLAIAALWPRRVREARSFDLTSADLNGVTHVLVTVVKGKPVPEAPAGFRWPLTFPAGRVIPFGESPWGVLELRPSP